MEKPLRKASPKSATKAFPVVMPQPLCVCTCTSMNPSFGPSPGFATRRTLG